MLNLSRWLKTRGWVSSFAKTERGKQENEKGSLSFRRTYQTHAKEEDLEHPAHVCGADNVAVADGGHGHHKEINTLPVAELVNPAEVGRVAGVFQLGGAK